LELHKGHFEFLFSDHPGVSLFHLYVYYVYFWFFSVFLWVFLIAQFVFFHPLSVIITIKHILIINLNFPISLNFIYTILITIQTTIYLVQLIQTYEIFDTTILSSPLNSLNWNVFIVILSIHIYRKQQFNDNVTKRH